VRQFGVGGRGQALLELHPGLLKEHPSPLEVRVGVALGQDRGHLRLAAPLGFGGLGLAGALGLGGLLLQRRGLGQQRGPLLMDATQHRGQQPAGGYGAAGQRVDHHVRDRPIWQP
jgi:hypothetical protein